MLVLGMQHSDCSTSLGLTDYNSSVHHKSCEHLAKQIIKCCRFLNFKSNRILGRFMNLSSGCPLDDQITGEKAVFGGGTQRSAY